MRTKVLLLGTNHFDTEGEVKLDAALTQFGPSHILVEGSRENHEVNLAAKRAALEVIDKYSVSDAIRQLLLFERDGLLRDITAVETFGRFHPEITVDFFRDEDAQNIDTVVATMKMATERVLQQIERMPHPVQEQLARQQMDRIKQGFSAVKRDWTSYGNRSSEVSFGEALRRGPDSRELDQRDQKKWSVLESLRDSTPEAKIATVTGAAHILRTNRQVSLLDRIETSGKFEVTRDMLCFR